MTHNLDAGRLRIEPATTTHEAAIIELALEAFAPIHHALAELTGAELNEALNPNGWQTSQTDGVRHCLANNHCWVAYLDDELAGFIAAEVRDTTGEITMVAVSPHHRRSKIGTALINHTLEWFHEQNCNVIIVETGGDDSHHAARALYESKGFTLLPIARYFMKLDNNIHS